MGTLMMTGCRPMLSKKRKNNPGKRSITDLMKGRKKASFLGESKGGDSTVSLEESFNAHADCGLRCATTAGKEKVGGGGELS